MTRSILCVDTYYPSFLESAGYGRSGTLGDAYEVELERLSSRGFGTGGAYVRALRELGWEANLVVPNAQALQALWMRSNRQGGVIPWGWTYALHAARVPGVRSMLHRSRFAQGVLLRQIRAMRPDVVFVQDLNFITPALARAIRAECNLLVGEIASPLPPKPYFEQYDLIVSALPMIVDQAARWGISSRYIPLGFDDQWASLGATPAAERPIDAVFVGSFSRHQPQTAPLLRAVAERVPGLQIYGDVAIDTMRELGLADYYRGPSWGEDMFRLLGQSKIVVNRHGTIAGDSAVNMRMYEATGMGAVLVTEAKSDLHTRFEPGVEVVSYRSAEEAAERCADLLAAPNKLTRIARAGRERTLREHTYRNRAETLAEILGEVTRNPHRTDTKARQ